LSDLLPLFREARRVLRGEGLLAFTVETHTGETVVLGQGLRYQHGAVYLRDRLIAAGLKPLAVEKASTRDESGEPVPGLVAIAIHEGNVRSGR
jgi:predicted TPR repeat methyltransferase